MFDGLRTFTSPVSYTIRKFKLQPLKQIRHMTLKRKYGRGFTRSGILRKSAWLVIKSWKRSLFSLRRRSNRKFEVCIDLSIVHPI